VTHQPLDVDLVVVTLPQLCGEAIPEVFGSDARHLLAGLGQVVTPANDLNASRLRGRHQPRPDVTTALPQWLHNLVERWMQWDVTH